MKSITARVLFCAVAFAASVVHGGQEAPGVAGVDVFVKQIPSKRDVTNGYGIFALDALPAGSYTLSFKARPADKFRGFTRDKVVVATVYSITIEGTKKRVKQDGLTSDKLVAGVDIPIELGAGGKIRGEVLPGASKKMVWIPKTPGTNIPGHWAEEEEASRFHTEVYGARDWQASRR